MDNPIIDFELQMVVLSCRTEEDMLEKLRGKRGSERMAVGIAVSTYSDMQKTFCQREQNPANVRITPSEPDSL